VIPLSSCAGMHRITVVTFVAISTRHSRVPIQVRPPRPIDPVESLRFCPQPAVSHSQPDPRLRAVRFLVDEVVLPLAVNGSQVSPLVTAINLGPEPRVHSVHTFVERGTPIAITLEMLPLAV